MTEIVTEKLKTHSSDLSFTSEQYLTPTSLVKINLIISNATREYISADVVYILIPQTKGESKEIRLCCFCSSSMLHSYGIPHISMSQSTSPHLKQTCREGHLAYKKQNK